jgi:hypothetical protein
MSLLDSNDVYVTSDTPVLQSLETINLTTGGVTDIGALADRIVIAALAYNGVLYGLDGSGNEYTINQTNAALTLVGNPGAIFTWTRHWPRSLNRRASFCSSAS